MQSSREQQGEIRKPSSVNNAKKQNGKDQSSLQENWRYRDTKGTFHAKMDTLKDRNSKNLTKVEDIKKKQQEYIEELYKEDLHDPNNHNGVITHLEPDILECEVKWA